VNKEDYADVFFRFTDGVIINALWLALDATHRTLEVENDPGLTSDLDRIMLRYFECISTNQEYESHRNVQSRPITDINYIDNVRAVLSQKGLPPHRSDELARLEHECARKAVEAVLGRAPE
jgi:hypothetical protein